MGPTGAGDARARAIRRRGAARVEIEEQAVTKRRLRDRIEAHLESRDVARVIYGSIIGLALVLALQAHPPTAARTAGLLVGSAVAVGLAELYSEVVGAE